MSLFPNIKFEEINYSHIEYLVDNKIPESPILDYKQDMLESVKLAKLITAFANSTGGFIIIGVSEERINGKKTGKPDKVLGVPQEDYVTRITDIAMSHSQPRIVPRIRDNIKLPGDVNRVIVIIEVQESLRPIMFYSKNHRWSNKWFLRINDKIAPADNSLMKKIFNKEKYILEKRLQNHFDIIRKHLEGLYIERAKRGVKPGTTDFPFDLKKRINDGKIDKQRLIQSQQEFKSYLRLFGEDLKNLGITVDDNISFCFSRYSYLNSIIRCPDYLNVNFTNLIEKMLNETRIICKDYFSIDLD
ncbi:hypothetical protein LCGC14_1338390 [marine sediment metagenome]|uniref:Schlafen AlbA-2 domain-containing protein n=1 Tax=marine sediment metagenome TaxID=412755 RepID=A0A0F9KE92_9ZZZZ